MDKAKIIKEYQIHKSDTGSAEVQIAILTKEIKQLQKHLKIHPKDLHSKRGLLKKVIKRKKLMKYLEREKPQAYLKLMRKLGLKKS